MSSSWPKPTQLVLVLALETSAYNGVLDLVWKVAVRMKLNQGGQNLKNDNK